MDDRLDGVRVGSAIAVRPRNRSQRQRLVLVDNDDGTVTAVWWRLSDPTRWRCRACGYQRSLGCRHTHAAAPALAALLFGTSP